MDHPREKNQDQHRHERYAEGERPRRDYDDRNPSHAGYGQMGFASDEESHAGDLHEEARGRRREEVRPEERQREARAGHSYGGGESSRRHDEQGYPAGGRSYAQYGSEHAQSEEGRELGSSYGGPEGSRRETPGQSEPMDEAGYGGYGEPGMAAARRPVAPQRGEPRRAETLRGGTYESYPGTIESGGERGGGRSASGRPSRDQRGGDRDEGEWNYQRGAYDLAGGYRRGRGTLRDREGPKNYSRPDERVRDEVCERLIHDTDVDLREIEVEVRDGEVHLSGTVEHRRDKHLIEDIADDVWGVKDIHNRIRVDRNRPQQEQREKDRDRDVPESSDREESMAEKARSATRR